MNLPYTNKHYRKFLRRKLLRIDEFINFYGYNPRNFRRWLHGDNFPRPPQIAMLNHQISSFYNIPIDDVIKECQNALYEDMKEFISNEMY